MKLPKHQVDGGEDSPFLKLGDQKHVRVSLDNLSTAGGQRSRGFPHPQRGASANNEKINKYEPKPGMMSKVRSMISDRPLLRWVLFIAVILGLFLFLSGFLFGDASYNASTPNLDFTLENIISAGIGLSKLAAEKIRQVKADHKEAMKVKGKTLEGVDEPVTVADAASNKVFINGFRTLFSHSRAIGNPDGKNKIDFTVVSEETDPEQEEVVPPSFEYISLTGIGGDVLLDPSKITLIIDPLDATKEYTEEVDFDGSDMLSFVTTLVCVVQDGHPIAGVVGRPYPPEGEMPIVWAAVAENQVHGASAQAAVGDAANTVTISRSHTGDAGDIVSNNFPGKTALKAGGAGYKSYLVLTGRADAYIHSTAIKTWDLCAGHALLLAAGGDVTDKDGNELLYKNDEPKFKNGLVAAVRKEKIAEYTSVLKNIDFAAKELEKKQAQEQAQQQAQ